MRGSHVQNLPVVLSRQSRVALPKQVGDELKRLILEGYFRPGAIMPSSRSLCDALQVGRSTVIEAFEQLKSEGYLVAAPGSATRVSGNIPVEMPESPLPEAHQLRLSSLSDYANRVQKDGLLYERREEPPISRFDYPAQKDKPSTNQPFIEAMLNLLDHPDCSECFNDEHQSKGKQRRSLSCAITQFRDFKRTDEKASAGMCGHNFEPTNWPRCLARVSHMN